MILIVFGSWIYNYLMSNEYIDYVVEEKKYIDIYFVNKIYIMYKRIYFFFFMYYMYYFMIRNFV